MERPQVAILVVMFLVTNLLGITAALELQSQPAVQEMSKSYQSPGSGLMFFLMIGIATGLMLLLYRLNAHFVLKGWMGLALFTTAFLFFGAFFNVIIAATGAALATVIRFKSQNMPLRNAATGVSFAGAGAMFGSILSFPAAAVLLVVLAIYDYFSVNISKHMVKLAESGMKTDTFMGFTYQKTSPQDAAQQPVPSVETAEAQEGTEPDEQDGPGIGVLGGGDIVLPMVFAATLIEPFGLIPAVITVFGAGAGLTGLLYGAQQGRFYPAIPVIAAGLFGSFGIWYAITALL